ncbi:MAG: DUF362 domain-containing protein [Planctomycetes bacterium]|nr:DUF362 domain-containing protein [Planctomycetota bacterium]MBI3845859.1 DUF362 domain-containing protein [Planctomycetota bacterium]
MLDPRDVVVVETGLDRYPNRPPFHPAERYPESPAHVRDGPLDSTNRVYGAVRDLLRGLGLDRANFGTPHWNPLGDLIHAGDRVLLKPNFVISHHPLGAAGLHASVANAAVLRPLVDYAFLACGRTGRITIADSPIKEVDFDVLVRFLGIDRIREFYAEKARAHVGLVDIRDVQVRRDEKGVMVTRVGLPGDPRGYREVDLGSESWLHSISQHHGRFRSTAAYYESISNVYHDGKRNVYSIPQCVLDADCVISIAKLKTHRKTGVTLSLKNLVGITNEKRWLPHHRFGPPAEGGDVYPDDVALDRRVSQNVRDFLQRHPLGKVGFHVLMPAARLAQRAWFAVRPGERAEASARAKPVRRVVEGDWHGNDTLWRTVLDLNRVLLHADVEGVLRDERQRRYLSVIDGIVGGEEEGPLLPTPRPAGVLLGGGDAAAVDLVCTRVMGFDAAKIPLVHRAFEPTRYPVSCVRPDDVRVVGAAGDPIPAPRIPFRASAGWKGFVEDALGPPDDPAEIEPSTFETAGSVSGAGEGST